MEQRHVMGQFDGLTLAPVARGTLLQSDRVGQNYHEVGNLNDNTQIPHLLVLDIAGYLFSQEFYCFFSAQEGDGKWMNLDSELIMQNGEIKETKYPTGHSVLIDARFEIPHEAVAELPEHEAIKLKEKLDVLNNLDAELMQNKVLSKRQTYSQSGMSEDSDYTSDINCPLPHQHNSSAHQFRGEPNYPLKDNRSQYVKDYNHPYDSLEGDKYAQKHSFEQMDSFEHGGSYERDGSFKRGEDGFGRGYSFERTESFEQEYGSESDRYGNERSDTECERSVHDDKYDRDGRYDQSVRDFEQVETGSYHSSNHDYDSEQEFGYSHRDYERTIQNSDNSNLKQSVGRAYNTNYNRDYYDSQDRNQVYSNYSRDSQSHSQESDYYPYPVGRSDTDSEPLSYNSRPNQHRPVSNMSTTLRQGSPHGSQVSRGSRVSTFTQQSTQDFSPINSRSSTNVSQQSTQELCSDGDLLYDARNKNAMPSPARARWIDAFNKVCAQFNAHADQAVQLLWTSRAHISQPKSTDKTVRLSSEEINNDAKDK